MDPAPSGSLNDALARAGALLDARPDLAERQALEILQVVPGEPRAMTLLGAARRLGGRPDAALAVLEPLAQAQPRAARVHLELGLTLAALDRGEAALAALEQAAALNPDLVEAWRAIGDLRFARGEAEAADAAYGALARASAKDPQMAAAAAALDQDRLAEAERLLRERLKAAPSDVAAMRLLAEAGTRLGRYGDVEALLGRCLELSPSYDGARYNLAVALYRQQKAPEAIGHLERLLAQAPGEPSYRNLMAACLGLVGEYDRAIAIYEDLLAATPAQPRLWLSYGHALRTAGRREAAVAAYHRAIALDAGLGDAYWSLANLKTQPFGAEDEARMRAQLARDDLGEEDRLHLHYALGKALEDAEAFEDSFAHYAAGAAIRRRLTPYDAAAAHAEMQRTRALFTPAFFAARAGSGCPAPDPIFIVGLPRSGSTLVEQILASHSEVEGTMELPDIGLLARRLGRFSPKGEGPRYPEVLADLDPAALAELGEAYIARTRVQRKLGRPCFIDKMPNNFQHIGLIQLILPRARIIDVRRSAMAACFSAFKQHFARGQGFSYDLADLGAYYRDYVELMAHFDAALPGRIVRVRYEALVEDTEASVRALLAACGLPFEPACLRFHENARAVRTASSEQVRRPIFREGLGQWRRYEPWLAPLRAALGPELAADRPGPSSPGGPEAGR